MIHARADYDGIQDASGKIPEDEPVFVLRSTDLLAPQVVAFWANLAQANGVAPAVVQVVRDHGLRMADYGRGKAHIPDVPEEVELRGSTPAGDGDA